MKNRRCVLPLLLDLNNEGRQLLRLLHLIWRDQQFGIKPFCQVGIEDGSHSCREIKASHEILVQASAPDHVDRLVTDLNRSHRGEADGDPVGHLLLPEKGGLVRRTLVWRNQVRRDEGERIFLITKFRRPLCRRKNRAATVYELQKIELLVVGQGLGLVDEHTVVRWTSAHCKRHAGRALTACDCPYPVGYLVPPAVELPAELCHQSSGLIFVCPLECPPGHGGDDPRHCAHAKKNRQREYEKKFAPKTHGFPISSQTFGKRQLPSGSSCQPMTFTPKAVAVLRCTRGITRCDCRRALSAAYRV